MRNVLINKPLSRLALLVLVVSFFVSATLTAMPMQGGLSPASRSAKETSQTANAQPDAGTTVKNTVLARNTTKGEVTTAAATPQKEQDKKTISRCWKRLMNMVREMNHAHRETKK